MDTKCQQLIHLSSPGQAASQILPGIGLCVCNICVSSYARPKTRHPTPDIKKPDTRSGFFLLTCCLNHHLPHSFKVSINYHIYFVVCITSWAMPIFYLACAVISKIMNKVLIALGTFLQTHYLATSLTIAIIISLTLVCAFGSNNAMANLSDTCRLTSHSFLIQFKS